MQHSDQPIRTTNYQATLAQASQQLTRRWILCGVGVVVAVGLTWIVLRSGVAAFILLLALLYCAYLPLVRRRLRPLWAVGQAMKTLAAENNLRYIETSKPNYIKHFQPAVARLGIWERNEQVVKGTYQSYPFETYVHTFRHPFANRYSRVATRVYCIQLPKELPHVFMRNLQSGNKYLGSLPRHFDDDQRVDLEGNFPRYFTVYTHRRTVTDALSLLAPNVMETLVRSNHKFDVEFVGNRMYLYSADYYTTGPELKDDLKTIDALLKHLTHHLKSWKFVIPNNQQYPYLVSRPGFGTVSLGDKYYSKAWIFIAGYTIYSLLRIWAQPEYKEIKIGVVLASDLVMAIVLLVFRRRYQLSRRNVAR